MAKREMRNPEKTQPVKPETIEEIVGQDPETVFGTESIVTEDSETVEGSVNKEIMLLNVREHPTTNGRVVTRVNGGSKIDIILAESTNDFYKVKTRSNVSGFCMKQFITIN